MAALTIDAVNTDTIVGPAGARSIWNDAGVTSILAGRTGATWTFASRSGVESRVSIRSPMSMMRAAFWKK